MLHYFISAASETAAVATAAVSESKLAAMSIFSKGLFTTLLGLIGVFLVLTLFFIAIKVMQRSKNETPDTKE